MLLFHGLLAHDLNVEHVLDELALDLVLHGLEHPEAFVLVLDERIALTDRAQPDPFLEVVHLVQVLAPFGVEHVQEHLPLDLAELLFADLIRAPVVYLERLVAEPLDQLFGR